MSVKMQNKFLEIISSSPCMHELNEMQRIDRINTIMEDMQDVFEEDEYYDPYEDLDIMSDIIFNIKSKKERKSLINQYQAKAKQKKSKEKYSPFLATTEERIRKKQLELGMEPDEMIEVEIDESVCRYGRCPLHEAIDKESISLIKEYAKTKRYLEHKDNNGNTPLDMAEIEGYDEAVKILKDAMKEIN